MSRNSSCSGQAMLPETQSISKETMEPFRNKHRYYCTNRTFGILRKKVVLLVCVLTLVTYSLVANSYSSMLVSVPDVDDSSVSVSVSTKLLLCFLKKSYQRTAVPSK
jgi:hypothetical protein